LKNELEDKKIILANLINEEARLDYTIEELKREFQNITQSEDFKRYGYITQNDLKSIVNEDNMNIIAIKAPIGTSIEMPNADVIEELYKKTKEVSLIIII
jgi:transcription factor E2F3